MRGGKDSNPNAREKSFSFVEDHLGIFANNFHGLTAWHVSLDYTLGRKTSFTI